MKLLLLHQHFNTPQKGGALRSYYLAKALVDRGIQTTVITTHNESQYKREQVEGIDVHYLPIAYDNRFGFYRRSLAFLRFVWGATKLAAKFKDAHAVYAISVPLTVGMAAMRIQSRYGIPFFFEVGDLWPDAPVQMGFVRNTIFKSALYRLEKTIYQNARAIVALSPAIEEAIRKKISGKPIHVVPNMADTDFFMPGTKNPELEKKYNVAGKFVVSYIGAIGLANGLDYFIECARLADRARLPIHFILCGDGAMLDGLTTYAKPLQNFSIIPFQNREGVKEVMNVTDASFICYKPVPILETGSPNKYFDALAAGKLVIVNFGGWIKHEIEQQKCGFYADPAQPTTFIKGITPFLENAQLLAQYQQAARALAERKYSRKLLGEKFASVVSGL